MSVLGDDIREKITRREQMEDRYNRSVRRRSSIEKQKAVLLEDRGKILDIEGALRDRGVLTGSRAWGIEHKDSDYDYFVPEIVYEYIQAEAAESARDGSYWFESIRITTKRKETFKEYNIWPVKSTEWDLWIAVNKAMKALIVSSDVMGYRMRQDKKFRVGVYESLRGGLGINVIRNERDSGPELEEDSSEGLWGDVVDDIPY